MATWSGVVYVVFVIDAYARRIVGWWASRTARASFVLDALEQALYDRRPVHGGGLIHHSVRGSQYVSIKYTERLAEAGVKPSVGSVGDSHDNARRNDQRPLQGRGHPPARAVALLRGGRVRDVEWVDWFSNRRLLEAIGNIPPTEAEARYYAMLEQHAMAA